MNKTELIAAIAERAELSKKDSEARSCHVNFVFDIRYSCKRIGRIKY